MVVSKDLMNIEIHEHDAWRMGARSIHTTHILKKDYEQLHKSIKKGWFAGWATSYKPDGCLDKRFRKPPVFFLAVRNIK